MRLRAPRAPGGRRRCGRAATLPRGAGALGEDADAGARPQRLDRLRQRVRVAGPRSIGIWPIPLRIGPRPRTSQSSDLARARIWRRLQRGDADHHRVPVAVVVADDQQRPALRQRLEALDPQPAPPGDAAVRRPSRRGRCGCAPASDVDFYCDHRLQVVSRIDGLTTQRRDRGRRPRPRVQERAAGGRRDRPAGRAGRDLRLPRPQRRRQVDDGADADHAAAADRGHRPRRRLRHRHARGRGCAPRSAPPCRRRRSTRC